MSTHFPINVGCWTNGAYTVNGRITGGQMLDYWQTELIPSIESITNVEQLIRNVELLIFVELIMKRWSYTDENGKSDSLLEYPAAAEHSRSMRDSVIPNTHKIIFKHFTPMYPILLYLKITLFFIFNSILWLVAYTYFVNSFNYFLWLLRMQ